MRAFLTGSQVYGQPRPDSDTDLVIFTDQETVDKLIEESDNKTYPIKFGKLNLITTTNEIEYLAWLTAMLECKNKSAEEPISRDEAISIHRNVRHFLKQRPITDSSGGD